MRKFTVEEHTTFDKTFTVENGIVSMQVDYDDVDHPEVDAGIDHMVEILNTHWDENKFQEKFKNRLIEIWNAKIGLREDYNNDLEKYLTSRGIVTEQSKKDKLQKELEMHLLEKVFIQTGGRDENPTIAKLCAIEAIGFIIDHKFKNM